MGTRRGGAKTQGTFARARERVQRGNANARWIAGAERIAHECAALDARLDVLEDRVSSQSGMSANRAGYPATLPQGGTR